MSRATLFSPGHSFSFVILHMTGLLGWGISPSQDGYLHKGQQKQDKRRLHPYLESDLNHDPIFQANEYRRCHRPKGNHYHDWQSRH